MRFSSVFTPAQPPRREPVEQLGRVRCAQPQEARQPLQPQPPARALPQDLDQRVREVGEW